MVTKVLRKMRFVKSQPSRLDIAKIVLEGTKAKSPSYFIERAVIVHDKVEVSYIDEADLESGFVGDSKWHSGEIALDKLFSYVANAYNGIVCADSDLTLSMFVEDNLDEVVKSYLQAGKEINFV
ncbi:hypothetical protein GCM10023149_48920 [Mucilaginibacter gynuensis]|uniref:Uncharacterized protein n=1 Tax=Mucilaginibacter gynuensis TaxID=1302236 RepID=A0ABP8HFW2_9SPHI